MIAYINNLENSQLNQEVIEAPINGFIVNENSLFFKGNMPIFEVEYLHYAQDNIITFSLDNAQRALKTAQTIHFMVWDLEWLRGKTDFIYNVDIYNKVDYLLCRSESHQKAIYNYCNRKPKIVKLNEYITR